MTEIYIAPFVSSAIKVISTMCSFQPTAGVPAVKESSGTWGVVTGIIGLAGPESTGNLMLSFEEPCALFLASKILMEEHKQLNKDVIDAVGELTNIITGSSKIELAELGLSIDMATPLVLSGKGIIIKQDSGVPTISIPFETPAGRFVIETNLSKR